MNEVRSREVEIVVAAQVVGIVRVGRYTLSPNGDVFVVMNNMLCRACLPRWHRKTICKCKSSHDSHTLGNHGLHPVLSSPALSSGLLGASADSALIVVRVLTAIIGVQRLLAEVWKHASRMLRFAPFHSLWLIWNVSEDTMPLVEFMSCACRWRHMAAF